MSNELQDFREHLERYRAVTLQMLDLLSDEQLAWRPGPDRFSCGQHLVHIAQTEDFHAHGLFHADWEISRLRLPGEASDGAELRAYFGEVRSFTRAELDALGTERLNEVPKVPDMGAEWSLRSWLWFLLEHELHHKGQLTVYLRELGLTPPFFAAPLPPGERPDIEARRELDRVEA